MAGKDEMEEQRNLSIRLYDVLEKVGASEKMRKAHQRSAKSWEILNTVTTTLLSDCLTHCYTCGSTYEGSLTKELLSDVDDIVCLISPNVVLDQHQYGLIQRQTYLMVIDDWTYPGYAKLQLMFHGRPLTRKEAIPDAKHDFDNVGRYCVRHFSGDNVEGPADKWVEDGIHYRDQIFAYKCNAVPEFARKRIDLLRHQGIISGTELEKLNRMGCMFVGAGYFRSSEKEQEWRISFSLQERHLMTKLNPTQHKVYILLKLIKKDIIEQDTDCKTLTSYQCKTCLLYAVAMTPARSWNPGNLINCLKQCIKLLILLLKNNFCPNFFNKEQNLFSKEGFSKFRMPLLHTLERLLRSNTNLLRRLQTDQVHRALFEEEWRWKNVLAMKRIEHRSHINVSYVPTVVRSFTAVMFPLCGGQYTLLRLVHALEDLQGRREIAEHTSEETQKALGYLYPWFHLHIATSLACVSYTCQDRSHSRQILKIADIHFRKADNTDLVNVRLAKASILYRCEQYEPCFMLLQQLENDFTYKVNRMCSCVDLYSFIFRDEKDQIDRIRTWGSIPVRKILKCFIACCVVFLPCHSEVVPTPLKYEMFRSRGTQPGSRNERLDFWFDWSVIDAKVFLYFMQYIVSAKLQKEAYKQVAKDNLRIVIKEDNKAVQVKYVSRELAHRETAYNLLGWIYMQEQRYANAMQCFLNSWKIRPFHNAAKFHMRDLCKKMSELQ